MAMARQAALFHLLLCGDQYSECRSNFVTWMSLLAPSMNCADGAQTISCNTAIEGRADLCGGGTPPHGTLSESSADIPQTVSVGCAPFLLECILSNRSLGFRLSPALVDGAIEQRERERERKRKRKRKRKREVERVGGLLLRFAVGARGVCSNVHFMQRATNASQTSMHWISLSSSSSIHCTSSLSSSSTRCTSISSTSSFTRIFSPSMVNTSVPTAAFPGPFHGITLFVRKHCGHVVLHLLPFAHRV